MQSVRLAAALALAALVAFGAQAGYTNFEASHVHPIDLTPSGDRLLVVNTPDALLEVFTVEPDGSLVAENTIPVGLEPVTVVARTDGEAWVVNNLSDSVSIVDLASGVVSRTLSVGDEPTDVAFAAGRAFVTASTEDAVKVFDLATLGAAPQVVALGGRDVRALAVSNDGQKVYAVVLKSGNGTTIVGVEATFPGEGGLSFDMARLNALGLRNLDCDGPSPSYPPLPAGVTRNPALTDPPDGIPKVGLIVRWNDAASQWQDETGQDWSHCLPYRPADDDLFVIDASSLSVSEVKHLGTTLFDVSVHPVNGKIYVPNTEARNFVRFEHAEGVRGHVVDNRLSVVDPGDGNAVTSIDLNTHIDRGSGPPSNLAERLASISQPGMLAWKSDGSVGYLTAIGSRKIFRIAGSCLTGACIFGTDRADPVVVEVGEGPTGVALREAALPEDERLYVLNRISHSLTVVAPSSGDVLDEIPLHDPGSDDTRAGRRFLYDAIDTSGHGDASCASCHISGDMDGLAWDLGDPSGEFVPYTVPMDNVRFIVPLGGVPVECDPSVCASHDGFDPQKGPMTTQSLRGMLEPLHWRGDRATMNDFNSAFVGLMGTEDIGPINGKPAGLSAEEMESFRQFALAIHYPPNPFRLVDDTMPCGTRATDPLCEVSAPGALFPGNPTEGQRIFFNEPVDAGQPCSACHTAPFGAAGGTLGGVAPTEPTSSDAAALFRGDSDGVPHSDLKVSHVRNMYEKIGPRLAAPGDGGMPETPSGFGYVHDGSVPDLFRFFSFAVFNLSAANQAQEVRDIVSFMFHVPTATRPAVGRQVTVAPGTPPTGSLPEEGLLAELIGRGDATDANRHCELAAFAIVGGEARGYHLSNGTWVGDVAGEPSVTIAQLRENAQSPITFTCATLDSGRRIGIDRDEDAVLNGDDCAPGDAATWASPQTVSNLTLVRQPGTRLDWTEQASVTGPSLRYDVLGGEISALASSGVGATICDESGLDVPTYFDVRADPAPGEGYYYLIRAVNPCAVADLGPGRESLETLSCG